MIIPVHMLAFENKHGLIREVVIDVDNLVHCNTTESALELVFKYGQNHFQSQQMRSVSVGDVIEFGNDYFMVLNVGFKKISKKEFEDLIIPTSRYSFHNYKT